MEILCADSATCDSPNHWRCVAPKARYDPAGPLLVYTQHASTATAVQRYGPGAASPAVAVTRGPLSAYAPVSSHSSTARPSSVPSAAAAVRILHVMLCRRVVTMDSSTLLTMRTGRPAFREMAAAMGSIFV